MNGVKGNALLERSEILNRDQIGHLALEVNPDHKKHIVTAFNPDSFSNPRYSH
jgi:hypothetical protein